MSDLLATAISSSSSLHSILVDMYLVSGIQLVTDLPHPPSSAFPQVVNTQTLVDKKAYVAANKTRIPGIHKACSEMWIQSDQQSTNSRSLETASIT